MSTSPIKQRCEKCGKVKSESFFYKYKSGERCAICQDCMLMYVDVRKPSTFLWILEELDYPYIEETWINIANKAYKRNPSIFSPKSVFGTYIRSMKMANYSDYHWADTEKLKAKKQAEKDAINSVRQNAYLDEEKERRLKEQFDNGEISEAQYRTLSTKWTADHGDFDQKEKKLATPIYMDVEPRQKLAEQAMEPVKPTEIRPVEQPEPVEQPSPQTADDALSSSLGKSKEEDSLPLDLAPPEPTFMDSFEVREEDIVSELTQEDMKYLALKWGMAYKPAEWVRLEEIYKKYESEYELNVDRAETLKSICKTKFKMDRAIDIDDIKSYKDLSTVYDQLRKSGKFTEQQNVEQQKREIDSIGELVQFVENKGGIIPQFDDPENQPQDKIDFLINDIKNYINNLVRNELGLGSLIESYVEKLRNQEVKSAEDLIKEGISLEEKDTLTQAEAEEFQEFQMSEIEEESRKLVEAFGSF